MTHQKKPLSEGQKKARNILLRPRLRFEPKSPEQLTAIKQQLFTKALLKATAGKKMPDGTIYLGLFNNKDWFVTAEMAKDGDGDKLELTFNDAAQYVRDLKAHSHDDWMLPPGRDDPQEPNILREMFNHQSTGAFKNTYDDGGSNWWWSRSRDVRWCDVDYRWAINFSDGLDGPCGIERVGRAVRAVRAIVRP